MANKIEKIQRDFLWGDSKVHLVGSDKVCAPWKGIWKVKAPTHVSFFVWSATWEKILTGDILRCRGFDFVDWCIMCRCNGEMVNHLLLHCSCGAWFLDLLGFLGSCQDRLQIRFSVGGTGLESTLLAFGI